MPDPTDPSSEPPDENRSRLRSLFRGRWIVAGTAGVVLVNAVVLAALAGSSGPTSPQSSCGGYFSGGGSGPSGCGADLSVRQFPSQNPVPKGHRLFYLVEATNNGPGTAFEMRVVDRLPLSVQPLWATASYNGYCEPPVRSRIAGIVDCFFYYIQSGEKVAITVTVVPRKTGTIKNIAGVSSDNPDPDNTNNTSTRSVTVQ